MAYSLKRTVSAGERESRLHICFVTPNGYPLLAKDSTVAFAGGAELQQVLIARGLASRGYRVSMICLDFGQAETCEIDGITVLRAFRQKAGFPGMRFIWPRLTSIWRCMKKADADIYCQRTASMLTGIVAAFCGRYGKKSVFSIAGETKIHLARDRCLFRYGIRNVDSVVVQSLAQQASLAAATGRTSRVIPNIYPMAPGSGSSLSGDVLWVGMIRQVKRPDIFLKLVESLPQFRFVMIGGESIGETSLYRSVKERAAALRNLDFRGFVPYEEVDPYFDRAALFVNTSDSEGFPNTFLQAWAHGVPTISFVDAGARMGGEVVGVQVRTVEELGKVVAELKGDQKLRTRLGATARDYVRSAHSPERVLDLYEDLFFDLTGKDSGTRAQSCARIDSGRDE